MSGGAAPPCEGDHRVPLAMPVAAAVPPYEYDHLVPLAVLAPPREGLQLAHRRQVARPPRRSLRRALEDGTLWQWIRERVAPAAPSQDAAVGEQFRRDFMPNLEYLLNAEAAALGDVEAGTRQMRQDRLDREQERIQAEMRLAQRNRRGNRGVIMAGIRRAERRRNTARVVPRAAGRRTRRAQGPRLGLGRGGGG